MLQSSNGRDEFASSMLPEYIKRGFAVIHGEYIPHQVIEAFRTRWGTISNETFVRVLLEGQGVDRVIAISVLGNSGHSEMKQLLRPFLESDDPQERWASAMALGTLHDDEAVPVLVTMLTEFLPAWQYEEQLHNADWFEENRIHIPSILDFWDDPSLVVSLRQALHAVVRIKQAMPASLGFFRSSLHFYQDALIRSSGSRGAFGALTGLALPQETLQAAIIQMVIGYCHIECDAKFLEYSWEREPQLREAMSTVMEQRFGLSTQEQENYLSSYSWYTNTLDEEPGF